MTEPQEFETSVPSEYTAEDTRLIFASLVCGLKLCGRPNWDKAPVHKAAALFGIDLRNYKKASDSGLLWAWPGIFTTTLVLNLAYMLHVDGGEDCLQQWNGKEYQEKWNTFLGEEYLFNPDTLYCILDEPKNWKTVEKLTFPYRGKPSIFMYCCESDDIIVMEVDATGPKDLVTKAKSLLQEWRKDETNP